jgi:DNA-binding IclR family transcriptional regulator
MTDPNNNPQEILDVVFDENISEILAEMETSPKKCQFLAEKFQLTPDELEEKLSLLIRHEFVEKSGSDSNLEFSVNSKKLSELIENSHNFENVDNGLAKMDSFLN